MLTAIFIGQIFENFLFGKMVFINFSRSHYDYPCPGLYSGIFAMYLQYMTSKRGTKKTTNILFYALCTLYVLTGATMIIDIITIIFAVNNNSSGHNNLTLLAHICAVHAQPYITFSGGLVSAPLYYSRHIKRPLRLHLSIYPSMHKLCFSFVLFMQKSSKIYRCWIVWGCNARVVFIPSFLALAFLGQSTYLPRSFISLFQFIACRYLASKCPPKVHQSRPGSV